MNFFSRAGEAVGVMIERLLAAASLGQMVFSQLGDTVVTRAQQFQALIKGDFHEIGQLEKNLSMLRDKSLAEHQAYVKRISGGNQEIAKSADAAKKKLNYQTGTQSGGPGSAASEYERATKAATDYITRLQQETEAIGLNNVQVKLLAAARAAADAPLESQRIAIMESAQA